MARYTYITFTLSCCQSYHFSVVFGFFSAFRQPSHKVLGTPVRVRSLTQGTGQCIPGGGPSDEIHLPHVGTGQPSTSEPSMEQLFM